MVPLGEILMRQDRAQRVDPEAEYRLLGVRLGGRGAFHRETLVGAESSAPALSQVKAGDLVYSRLFASQGAFAAIPDSLDGCWVSNEFPLYRTRTQFSETEYVRRWLTQEPVWRIVERDCFGSTPGTRNRYAPHFFEALKLPLPPLDVQRRIVERLDAIEARISRIGDLRMAREADCEQLLRTLMSCDPGTSLVPISDLVQLREPDVTVDRCASYDFAGVYSFGRGVFRAGTKTGMDFAYPRLSTLHTGDFTYPKLMAWEGALGVVPPECDGCVVSTEFPVFEVLHDRVLPEVLDVHFRNPSIWPLLAGASTGTNARRRRLNPSDFLAYQFPLPSRSVQARVAKAYRLSQEIRQRDQGIDAETRAVLPALLAEAFGGGLGALDV
jgi:type I restriction enzyme S subunit